MEAPILGIDLGTTHSLVAVLEEGGPRLLPNALGEFLTPSVVALDESGALLVGRTAREYAVLHPERAASCFKRHMGRKWQTRLADKSFSAPELSSLVLASLKGDAERALGVPVARAVVTVPAYFNEPQRQATIQAGKLAGLEVARIVNEPTAAALAYGLHESREDRTFLVFDLGGGTFDVSVVELFAGVVEVKATAGEAFLGGEDFTRVLATRALAEQGESFEHAEAKRPKQISRLLEECERAKRKLSSEPKAVVRIPDAEGAIAENARTIEIDRPRLEEWVGRVLARCDAPLRRVMSDAKLAWSDLAEVLLVGGATRMPAVADLVAARFGRPPACRIHPDHVVALGAAVQAGLLADHRAVEDLVVTDVAPFTLGIETTKEFAREFQSGYFLPIIDRNTTLPASRVETVQPLREDQTELVLKVFQGESRRVEGNVQLGELKLPRLPRGPIAEKQIDVRFTYDLNGVLEVEATIQKTGAKATLVLTRGDGVMSPAEIERAVAKMAALKTHPRDEAVNRLLLRRAERLFAELSAERRAYLGMLLDQFERALASQDPGAVEEARGPLEEFLGFEGESGDDADDWRR